LRGLELPAPSDSVRTALCRHDASYSETLAQLPSAPAMLYATYEVRRLGELLSSPQNLTVGIVGSRGLTNYAREVTFTLAHELVRRSDCRQWRQ
jgi:predicted Rossmann fold nucleotide-binding protein DprA/Smf involved in DNA uptake